MKSNRFKLYKIVILFTTVISVVFFSVSQMTSKGNRFIRIHAPTTDILFNVRTDVISGHLWIKEYLEGNEITGDKRSLYHFREASLLIDILISGGKARGFVFEPLNDNEIVTHLRSVNTKLNQLSLILGKRLNNKQSPYSQDLGIQFDEVYSSIIKELEFIEELYHYRINANYEDYSNTVRRFEFIITITFIIAFIIAINLNLRILKSERLTQKLLSDLQKKLEEGKTRELKLNENRFLLTEAQELASIGSYRIDLKKRVWESSKVLDKIFGLDEGYEKTIESWLNVIHHDDRDMLKTYFMENVFKNHDQFNKKYRIINNKTGKTHWVHSIGKLVISGGNEPAYLLGSIQDITEELNRSEKIEKSETRFRTLFDDALNYIEIISPSGLILDVNKSLLKMLGYSKSELVGEYVSMTWAKHVYRQNMFTLESLLSKGDKVENHLTSLCSKNGNIIEVELNASPYYETGELIAIRVIMTDITVRLKFEHTLINNERIITEYFENSIDGNIISDNKNNIIRVNSKGAKILGLEQKSILSIDVLELFRKIIRVHDSNREQYHKIESNIKDLMSNKDTEPFVNVIESQYITPEGDEKRLELKIFPIFSDEGSVFGIILRDITEQFLFANELTEKTKKLVAANKLAKLGYWELDIINNHLYWSDEIFSLFELEKNEVETTYDGFLEHIYPDDREMVNKAYTESLENKQPYEITHRIRTKRGTIKHVIEKCNTQYDANGNPAKSFGTVQDVTKETVLSRDLKILSDALGQTPISIVITDINGTIQYVNSYFLENTGYNYEEAIGSNPRILKSDSVSHEFYENLWQIILSGNKWEGEFENKKKDGTYFYEWAKIFPVFDSFNNIINFIAIKENITEKKAAEEDRIKLEKQLQQSQKLEAIGTMAGGIAHDFNNILQAMFLYIGMIQDEVDANTAVCDDVNQLYKSANRAKDLVEQILTFSKKQSQELKPTKLQDVIKESLKLVKASADKSIRIKENIDMTCDSVLCDNTKIHQVIINLCNNALHSMRDKPGILTIEYLKDNDKANMSILTISDTGTGIPNDIIEKIFDPFFTTKNVKEGTGLGLSVVHGIVKEIGATIYVDSELGNGTRFRIIFPTVEKELRHHENEINEKYKGNGQTILFVDDEEQVSEVGARFLLNNGYKVIKAEDGVEAFTKYENTKHGFDILITDIAMPKMNGHELVEKILNTYPEQKIVLMSGKFSEQDKERYLDKDNITYITKPWEPKGLLKILSEQLTKRENENER